MAPSAGRVLSRKALARGVTRFPSEHLPDAGVSYPLVPSARGKVPEMTRWMRRVDGPLRTSETRPYGWVSTGGLPPTWDPLRRLC
jgi:hypothetical protein